MTYNENIIAEANKIIVDKKLNASISMNGLSAFLIIEGVRKDFVTPKLAKIYLENIVIDDKLKVETTSSAATTHMNINLASGIVSQKNDETPKKRRGRPKKADNDRTRRI